MTIKKIVPVIAVLASFATFPALADQNARSENAEKWMYENYGPRENWPTYDTPIEHNKKTHREVDVGRPEDPNHPIFKTRMGDHQQFD